MPTPQRRQPAGLMTRRRPAGVIARLLAEPHRFGFFQAVRMLNRWLAQGRGAPARYGLDERLRFRNNLSLSFPPSEIAGFEVEMRSSGASPDAATEPDAVPFAGNVQHIAMTPAFMSLLGTGGALPIHYSELLAERETYHRDRAARAFLDIFQHRAVSLFYEGWRKHRLAIQFEDDARHRFLPLVLALAGVGQSALRDRLRGEAGGVADDTIAYFGGLLQQRPVSAASIRQIVSEYFAVAVRVDQFVGRWFTLPAESHAGLGYSNATLGLDAVLGERVWQRDLRLRLTIGPMPRAKLRRFLPGGQAALALRELLTLLTGVTLEYEVRLALHAGEVQGVRLDEGDAGAHLGWDSFLSTQPERHDRTDAGYDIHALH